MSHSMTSRLARAHLASPSFARLTVLGTSAAARPLNVTAAVRQLSSISVNLPQSQPPALHRRDFASSPPPPLPTTSPYPATPSPPTQPANPSTTPTHLKHRSLARRLLRLTFFGNLIFFGLLAVGGFGLYAYYSWIAPAKVVYTRGRDGIKYAVGVYGTGKEWYEWGSGKWVQGLGGGKGEEVVVEEPKKKKGWLW